MTTGEKVKQELVASGVDENKVISIPTYPDEKKFQPSEQTRKELQEKYQIEKMSVIGMMTGLYVRKRPLSLLPIMKEVVFRNPQTKLLIAGQSFDKQMAKLKQEIKKYNLEKHVIFVGYVRPEEFLNVIDIYVCPSSKEGIPQALMQAMMLGKAALSTEVGSIVDLNIDDNLILVQKDDMQGLKEALLRIVEDESLRKRLAAKNAKLMYTYCSRTVMKNSI